MNKVLKIVYNNIPKIVIASLIGYTYFFIGPCQAVVAVWFVFLSKAVGFVVNREKARRKKK